MILSGNSFLTLTKSVSVLNDSIEFSIKMDEILDEILFSEHELNKTTISQL